MSAGPVTVLIPTYDHGPLVLYALASALGQTYTCLEIVVVGDGAPAETAALVSEVARHDPRVRYAGNPKGLRHGEEHRARALAETQGKIVAYLADDDLWLPRHVETVVSALDGVDFVHTLPVRVNVDGSLFTWAVDLELPEFRALLLSGRNRIPFACGAHTREAYARTPGWTPAPEGTFTDLFMWQKFLSVPGMRFRSLGIPTVLHFQAGERRGWTLGQRSAELENWLTRMREASWEAEFVRDVLDAQARLRARTELYGPQA